jgi:hypothetical protein
MSRCRKYSLTEELAWALKMAVSDLRHKGVEYGSQATVTRALKRYAKEKKKDEMDL